MDFGFLVWDDIANCIGKAIHDKRSLVGAIKKFSLHTKIVLIMQIFLTIIGGLLFLALENNNPLTIGNMGIGDKLLVSMFHSVSSRTAGMFSVNMNLLTVSTKLLMIFLMFIGGAPGSMAGGLKTVTLVVIIFGIISKLRGRKNIYLFKRTISNEIFIKACIVFISMIILLNISLLLISINMNFETDFIDIIFDTVSALATVGLGVGSIQNMNSIGLIVIMLLMFIGRVGTVSTAIAFIIDAPKENDEIVYAKENVIVG